MLIRLNISNLATIHQLEVDFKPGFTILTGETGAGKSILVDALRFVMGNKAAVDQIRSGASSVTVEATFDLSSAPEVVRKLSALEIPSNGELILRRTMQENGRSRAVANDCSVTQAKLEDLGGYLINVHGQHDNQLLLNPETHIQFLDAFGSLDELRQETTAVFHIYSGLLKEKRALTEAAEERAKKTSELEDQLTVLRSANLHPDEMMTLKQEHGRLSNVERLAQWTGLVCHELYEGDDAILTRLVTVGENLVKARALDSALDPVADLFTPLRLQLEEAYRAISTYHTNLEADPNRLEQVNERLADLERIQRRFGGSIETAMAAMTQAEEELALISHSTERMEQVNSDLAQVAKRLHDLSSRLSKARTDAGARLDQKIMQQFKALGMEKAIFKTDIQPVFASDGKTPKFTSQGKDNVEFLLTTNPGQALRPLSRTASGGELSRTMLATKTVLAGSDPTASLIFDEVDAGISGATAEQVGLKLRQLAESHQVLCVTHLPQIAALSEHHILVSKKTDGAETYTEVEPLEGDAKIKEVARLLSGLNISNQSMASATEMVEKGSFQNKTGD